MTVGFPAGTYTLGTFAFPIAPGNNTGSATIFLPTPFGFSDTADSTDGSFSVGYGALNTLRERGLTGGVVSEALVFPDINAVGGVDGKYSLLTYQVAVTATPAPSSLLIVALGVLPTVSLLRRRAAK